MLKIIHLLDRLRFGGAESVALNYARLMAGWGAASRLCGRADSADFEHFASQTADVGRFSWRALRRADVIFIHSNRNLLKIFLLRPFLGRGRRIVYIQHLPYSVRKFRGLAVLINRVCTDFIRITPITEQLVSQYIKIPVSFIPNFFVPRSGPHERADIRKATRDELQVSEDQIVVLFSGALKPGKGLDGFLARATSSADDPSRRFVVVGDGPERDKITAYPHENLLWMGWQADVERFLLAADVYLFLSAREMMPMALVEALAMGVSVEAVASPAGNFLLGMPDHGPERSEDQLKNMLRKRILHIQVLPKMTGVQRVSLEIFRALPDEEYDKTILFGGPMCEQTVDCVDEFRKSGCKVLFLNDLQREIGRRDWRAFCEIYRLCRHGRFEVVHTHSTKPGIVGRVAARLAGVPRVVHTVHGVAFHRYVSPPRRAVFWLAEMTASLFSHRIALVSNHYKKYFWIFGRRVRTIYNGLPPLENVEAAAQSLPGGVRLLFTGRFEPAKDPLTLLRALAILHREGRTEFRLTMLGDGSLLHDCQMFTNENGLVGAVDFAGWQRDVASYYEKDAIFCLSSIHEAFGICLLEAGARGLATVATRVGGVPEVVEDGVTGLLVPPRDPWAMAEALKALADDPRRRERMGRAARERVRQFSAERMTEAYKSLYNNRL